VAPSVDFRGQPYEENDTAAAFLLRVADDDRLTDLTIVTAWARLGGVARLSAALRRIRDRGGRVRAIVGVDAGIATRPGLEGLLASTDETFIFHDPTGRTFHPKLYLAEGPSSAALLVGSSNATAGGLWFNYEASLEARFRLPDEQEEPALARARGYIEKLLADEELRLRLDDRLLDALQDHPDFDIAETERRARGSGDLQVEGADQEELNEGGSASLDESGTLFGSSRFAKAAVPSLPADARALRAPRGISASAPVVDHHWVKTLSASDAQRPPSPGSNPTGNLRLTQAGNQIEWLTWFRRVLFGPATWESRHDRGGNPIDTATISFHVAIESDDLGVHQLVVDHAPHRESGQSNHATVLHWGSLRERLEQQDLTGRDLELARLSDGTYRLRVG